MQDDLSETFTALADPTRRAIIARLARGEASVTELAEPFALSLPTVSRHIAALERAGLVRKRRRGQERTCTLDTDRLRAAEDWIAEYRSFFESRFDALARQLADPRRSPRPTEENNHV
ncbi:Helix-turn-helix domain-containing protein [Microbacterium sp. cf046]|uniref:ArsR/SmtB family transcription factor n=1 Tax=Microbacterium sp. cf046 TaxID=1761803 RepID=UPI0008E17EE9|nr:metalloregulator ArsR/SmtB family transcription factor [Microbacterium sp. cf046]SFR88740.1 Helix-turn-helix domain-containing protein [Microbacterium sp. cf046]